VIAADLTVVVPARDAARTLARCLGSLAGFAPAIVVDAQSADDTAAIAQRFGARVLTSAKRSPALQRNEGIAACATRWVLCLDADEVLTGALRAEIAERTAGQTDYAGYWIPRVTWYLGRRIRFSGWQRDRVLRLFQRERGSWRDEALHEGLDLRGRAGVLRAAMEHHSYESLDDVLEKLDRYSTWGARDIVRRRRAAGPWQMVAHPPARFVKTYLLRQGFRDGRHGVVLAVFAAYGVLLRYAKAWEMRRAGNAHATGTRA
jgi:glycosyltransferase involved in cell wall biosynthesis